MQSKNVLLRQERFRKGWSQQMLADFAGIGESTVERAERGEPIGFGSIQRLCARLEKTPEQLGLLRAESESQERNNPSYPSQEDVAPTSQETESEKSLDRRTALQTLAALGFTIVTSPRDLLSSQPGKELIAAPVKPASIALETLHSFADLNNVCWRLSATELETAKDLLSTYLPRVETLAQQSFEHQALAAGIASQGYQLASILAGHKLDFITREAYSRRALQYGPLTADRNIHLAALMRLVTTLIITNRPLEAVQTYQAALPYLDEHVSPLLLSDLEIKIAVAYAQCGQDSEAERHAFLAQQSFPEHPEADPCFLYADSGYGILFLWEGLTHLERDNPNEAKEAFEKVEKLPSTVIIPKRIRMEIVNHQAEAAVALGDKEWFKDRIRAGIRGAHELNSDKRRQEVWDFYGQARKVWPHETDIKKLREELISGAV